MTRCFLFGFCEHFKDFRQVSRMSQDSPFMEETGDTGVGFDGLQVERGRISENHLGGVTCIRQVDGDSDMAAPESAS